MYADAINGNKGDSAALVSPPLRHKIIVSINAKVAKC